MKTIQGRTGGDVVGTMIRLPRLVRDEVKIQAIRAGRSFNTHVAMILGEAAGVDLGGQPPAAMTDQQNHREAQDHGAD